MHVRIDEIVKSKEDVLKLGINNGDYITIDTKTQITPSGFIKSRFLDDKMSVAITIMMISNPANVRLLLLGFIVIHLYSLFFLSSSPMTTT